MGGQTEIPTPIVGQIPGLHPDDLADLRRSGLSNETIMAMGCRSATADSIANSTRAKVESEGYSIPYPGLLNQEAKPYCRWRLRHPVKDANGKIKQRYVGGLGDDPQLYIPPGFSALPPNRALLVLTEGEKKACAGVEAGIHCVALQGVWAWCSPGARAGEKVEGEGVTDKTPPLAPLLGLARKFDRVLILGDSDLTTNPQARAGFDRLTQSLVKRGVRAAFGYCPPAIVGDGPDMRVLKQGLDDWLLKGDQARRSMSAIFRAAELSRTDISDLYHAREIALLFGDHFCFSRGLWWLWSKETVIWQESNGRQLAGQLGDRYRDDARQLNLLAYMVESVLYPESDSEEEPAGEGGKKQAKRKALNLKVAKQVDSWLGGIKAVVKELLTAGHAIECMRTIEPALKMAEHLLTVPGGEWDAVEHHLAVQNGVVDLRTAELLPPSPQYRVTKQAGAAFDPTAKTPKFQAFLERVQPDPEVRDYLQRLAGYCAVGTDREQQLFSFVGGGMNGKGKFVGALMFALGTYAAKGTSDMISQHKADSPRYDLAAVAGARMVSISESGENVKLDENTFKSITGGDQLTCRFPYGKFFTFKPCFTILLDTNHSLQPHETGVATWRRHALVPWLVEIPEGERNKDLGAELEQEVAGILAWVVAGAKLYLEDGLTNPAVIIAATREQRESSDDLRLWLLQNCLLNAEARTQSNLLYLDFCAWSRREGNTFVMSNKTFKKRLEEKRFSIHPGSFGRRYWHGINLRNPAETLDGQPLDPDPRGDDAAQPQPSPNPPEPIDRNISPDELKSLPGKGRTV